MIYGKIPLFFYIYVVLLALISWQGSHYILLKCFHHTTYISAQFTKYHNDLIDSIVPKTGVTKAFNMLLNTGIVRKKRS